MIVVRDKSIKTLTKCEPFIKVITDDTAIAFEKHKEDYPKSSDQIKNGLTKQDNQHYYFEHDIVNTPRIFSKHNNCFAYHIYPITDDIANRIIKKEYVSKWEILFNAFFNYRKLSVNNWPDFFWPADLPTSGPFWTDVDSYSEVERVLKGLSAATDEDWINLVRLHQPNLIGWDEGNKILMSTINSILKT